MGNFEKYLEIAKTYIEDNFTLLIISVGLLLVSIGLLIALCMSKKKRCLKCEYFKNDETIEKLQEECAHITNKYHQECEMNFDLTTRKNELREELINLRKTVDELNCKVINSDGLSRDEFANYLNHFTIANLLPVCEKLKINGAKNKNIRKIDIIGMLTEKVFENREANNDPGSTEEENG